MECISLETWTCQAIPPSDRAAEEISMIVRQFLSTDPVALSYVFGCGGRALAAVVDPVGPIEPYQRAAESTGMRIRYVIDTHIHADHLTSGRELAAATGAVYVLFRGAPVDFAFDAVEDGTVLE